MQKKGSAGEAIRKDRDGLIKEQVRLSDRRVALREEHLSYEGRTGRIPPALDKLRHEVARAAGFLPEDLPFLAELIDVARVRSNGGPLLRRSWVPVHVVFWYRSITWSASPAPSIHCG